MRYYFDASFDKLVTVPNNTPISQIRSYVIQRFVDLLYAKAQSCAELRKVLPEKKPTSPSQVIVFWKKNDTDMFAFDEDEENNADIQIESREQTPKELILSNDKQQLQELIKDNYWRIDNLTPGLDLMDNFWSVAM